MSEFAPICRKLERSPPPLLLLLFFSLSPSPSLSL
ncbi:unnamed protein product [Spirodela intermedia]|uniref:Uncharacterized protein n=1 Tax=Spirodela intermedia TaxID=51605 RepID=A0A7I8LHV8_SPIIN|nr:unnamed protein product [Spirodela intermedia]